MGSYTQEEVSNDNDLLEVPLPRVSRIRLVSIDSDGIMSCSCCAFQNQGLFCEHQCATAKLVYELQDLKFGGFTHHDVALRYKTAYMHLAYRHSTPMNIRKMFDGLVQSDIQGPKLQISIPSVDILPIQEKKLCYQHHVG